MVRPNTSDDVIAPIIRPVCWCRGVAPTRNPVLRSCDVAPALAAAVQTMAPTAGAIGALASPVQPSATKIVQVRISVAIVIPEIGFDELPISPVMGDETATKKKPKMPMR